MISGIFSATFASNLNLGGSGVAIFSGNTIHGGDAAFYYRGKYKLDERNQIAGTIEVVKHAATSGLVLGPLDRFRLILNGIVNHEGIELSGQVEGQPEAPGCCSTTQSLLLG